MKTTTVKAVLATIFITTVTALVSISEAATEKEISTRKKRGLPLQTTCDPRQVGTCYKADLVDSRVADCKKNSIFLTCNPVNDYWLSSVVDVPDVSKHGVNCEGDRNRPIVCGESGTDTRCVCDKAYDYKRPVSTIANQCRCQYWPKVDPHKKKPSYCTQFDNGGKSRIHFYTCCNNCNDHLDTSCDGKDYQGGGSKGLKYCDRCGNNTALGGGRETYSFNCVSCSQQRECEKECDDKYKGILAKIPGFCPKWSGCFRKCCIEAEERLNAELQALLSYG